MWKRKSKECQIQLQPDHHWSDPDIQTFVWLSSYSGNLIKHGDFTAWFQSAAGSNHQESRGYHSRSQPQGLQSQGTSCELRHLRTFWGVRRDAAAELFFWHPFHLWIVWNPHRCERPGCTPSHSNYKLPEMRTKRDVNKRTNKRKVLLSFHLIYTQDLIDIGTFAEKELNCAIASRCQQRAV